MIPNNKKTRETHQRQIVYDAVISRCDHPTADTIYEVVRKKNPRVSKGTVYRNLNMLTKLGKISHIRVPGGDRFDKTLEPHHHVMCMSCGKVSDVTLNYNVSDDKCIEEKTGFTIIKHNTLFEGLCPKCKNEKGGK